MPVTEGEREFVAQPARAFDQVMDLRRGPAAELLAANTSELLQETEPGLVGFGDALFHVRRLFADSVRQTSRAIVSMSRLALRLSYAPTAAM